MMKFLLKALVAFAFLASSSFASAVCYRNLNDVPPGGPGLFSIQGMFCTQNIPPQHQGVAGPRIMQQQVGVPQPYYGTTAPFGTTVGGSSFCAGLVERGGRYLGARDGNDAKHTEGGGLLGFLAGNVFCPMMSNQGQRVVVQQGVVVQQAPQQFANPTYGGVQQQAVVQGQRPATQLQETSFAAAGDQDTCRLRNNGNVVAEIKLPLSVKREEAKQICNEWQQREVSARGLR